MRAKRKIEVGQFWRHKKTDGVYCITGFCFLEADTILAVLYTEETADEGTWPWARVASEFLDGRFEKIEVE